MKIRVGIIGAGGYVGYELARLLAAHPAVDLVYLGSTERSGTAYSTLWPSLPLNLAFETFTPASLPGLAERLDLLFLATPHNFSAQLLSLELIEKLKIIDLSADFRLKNPAAYEKWYGFTHPAPELLALAVYGLCELNAPQIRAAQLIANPGCYTSASILALAPLLASGLADPASLIIDAKSGVSGAGRGAKAENLFCEVNENIKAYAITSHRHTPEIEEQLATAGGKFSKNGTPPLLFTPHLVPMQRGILATCYASPLRPVSLGQVRECYEDFYAGKIFINILPEGILAQTRWVRNTNRTDLALHLDERTGRLIIIAALDNLIKGAAGAAVQNLNLLFDLPEDTGLGASANL